LTIDTLDDDVGRGWGGHGHACWHLVRNRVRETQRQVQLVTSGLGFVAHAHQRQLLLEAFGHAGHHIVDQGTQGAGHRIRLTAVIDNVECQRAAIVFYFYQAIQALGHGAQRALDSDRCCSDRHIGASWDSDRHFSYSGHCLTP
jgi:hypothetical protein